MDLNMTIVADDLGDLVKAARIDSDWRTRTRTHVELFEPGTDAANLDDTAIYLVDSVDVGAIPTCTGMAFAVYNDAGLTVRDVPQGNDAVIIAPGTELPALIRALTGVFAKYDDWIKEMREIVARTGSIDELVEASMPIFDCNIMIHDENFRIISYKLNKKTSPRNSFASSTKGGFFTKKQVDMLETMFHRSVGMGNPFKVKGPHSCQWPDAPRDLSLNIFLPNKYTVRINLGSPDYIHDVPNKYYSLIEEVGYFIRYAYLLYPPTVVDDRFSMLSNCISRLYEGQMVPKADFERAVAGLGWDHYTDFFKTFVIVPLDEKGNVGTLTNQPILSIANRINSISRELITLRPNGKLCVLTNLSRLNITEEALRIRLRQAAKENNLIIVETMPSDGIRHTKYFFTQAAQLADFAGEKHYKRGLYRIDEISMDYAYNTLAKTIEPFSIVPYGLVLVVRHDNLKGSQLYPTLRTYIECDCSPVKAAKQLYIERSTFYYRLNQALELLGMDLEDPKVKTQLMMAFLIMDRETQDTMKRI